MRIVLASSTGHVQLKVGARKLGLTCVSSKKVAEALPSDVLCSYTLWDGSARQRLARNVYLPAGARVLCVDLSWIRELPASVQCGWLLPYGVGINGSGVFPAGTLSRWESFGLQCRPWREGGEFVLVCGNKGSMYAKRSVWLNHDDSWVDSTITELRTHTKLPIYYKPHPITREGKAPLLPSVKVDKVLPYDMPLESCLPGAHCMVVYASSSATTALLNGIPVVYTGPTIMTKDLCSRGLASVAKPYLPDNREEVFARLSGSVWRLSEVASGDMFKHFGIGV